MQKKIINDSELQNVHIKPDMQEKERNKNVCEVNATLNTMVLKNKLSVYFYTVMRLINGGKRWSPPPPPLSHIIMCCFVMLTNYALHLKTKLVVLHRM